MKSMTAPKNHAISGLILLSLLAGGTPVAAFTATNADTIFNAYNTAFYVTNGGNAYYKTDNGSGTGAGWWTFAEEIEMAEDCYARSGSASFSNTVSTLCNGFASVNGTSWTYNDYNDDMTWAVIAFARGYLVTSNATFLNIAEANYNAMYSRGWDTNFTGGGLWWSTAKGGKNACINGPAAVAGSLLYNITGNRTYLADAEACYAWERRVLFNTNTGAIDDSIATTGSYNTWASTYNQGTFIGAANFLYRITRLPFYYQDAILAAKCTENSLATAGILPDYGSSDGDFGGFNGIFARWAGQFAHDQNLWASYVPWLNTNGNAAWNVRNTNNLSWYDWSGSTPAGTNVLPSWACSDSVIIMQVGLTNAPDSLQVTPGIGFTAAAQYSVAPNPASVNLMLTNTGAATVNWSLANTAAWLAVSAASGTMAAGDPAFTVQVSLNSSAITNLPTGSYYTTLWLTNLTSGVVQGRAFALVISAASAPLALTGYNAAVLAANTATASVPGATAFDVINNFCFYQAGLGASTRGLPPDGVFMSQADGSTVFQLQPYGSINALVLGYTHPSSATLTLPTPQAFNSLAILACSANTVGTVGTLVLTFTNGTQSAPLNFNAPDWFGTTSNIAMQGFDRLKLGASLGPDNDGAAAPNMFQTTLNLAALGLTQPIASITFTKPPNSGGQQSVGIFAVSGAVMPAQAGIVQQPQSVTNTQPALAATFNVVASGTAPLNYQWFYSAGGAPGSFAPIASQTNSSLSLSPVLQTTNAGSFFVVVSNSLTSVTSSVATLTVFRAPVITQQPAPANVWKFTGASNSWVVAANAAQPVYYQWSLNGTNLPTATTATNRLTNLQITSSGAYSVVVSNSFGVVTSSVASLTVVPAPTYPFGKLVLSDHALGYWRLDETSGTMAHDYIGGDNGTYTPKVHLGQPGDNLVDTHPAAGFGTLSSSNSCATNMAVDFSTTGNANFSIEAWVEGGSQTTDAGVVSKGYGSGGEQFNLDCGGGSHAFRFFVRDASGNAYLANSTVTPGNSWHHLVGVCNETNGYVYLYVDGTNVASATVGPYVGILTSSMAMCIGSRQAGTAPVNNNQFVGTMEEVAVYGYALSATQVQNHFQAATNRPPVFLSNPFTIPGANVGQLYSATIATNASDPNGNAMTFARVSGPAWLGMAANGTLSGTPYAANAGANVFVVSVADAYGMSNTATMNVPVTAAPPVFLSNPFTAPGANAGQLYSANIATNASDPNGYAMTFAIISGPAWLGAVANGTVSGTPYSANVGTNVFVVSVADAYGMSNTATMNLPVIAAPPIVMNPVFQTGQLTLNWAGGIAPYQVQFTTNLASPDWQPLGTPLGSNSISISLTNDAAFYRLFGQ